MGIKGAGDGEEGAGEGKFLGQGVVPKFVVFY